MVKGPLPLPYPENFIERADFQRKHFQRNFSRRVMLSVVEASPGREPCESPLSNYVIARSDCFCRAVAIPRKGTL